MQFYRRNLPHMQRDATPHFLTFNTKFRQELPDWARDVVLGCCDHDHGIRYRLRVAVVMPEHVHLVLTPLIDEARGEVVSLAEILKGIKGASSHAINRRLQTHRTVWQEESFDRVIRSSESLDAKIDYVLQNPVRRGLIDDPQKYPWTWRDPYNNPFSAGAKIVN